MDRSTSCYLYATSLYAFCQVYFTFCIKKLAPRNNPLWSWDTDIMVRIFLNSVIIYAILVLLMRLIGKRQLGELELPELIVTFLISEAASEPLVDPDTPILKVLVPIVTLLMLEYLFSLLALKSVKLRGLLTGKPALLIVHGRIDQTQMRKNRITPDELTEALRNDGILDLGTVEYAVLEANGKLNIIPTPGERTVTAAQMNIETQDTGYPVIVINNGRVLSDNLRLLGFDERWLSARLREHGVSEPQDVYMMTADRLGGVYLAPKEGG